MPLFRAAMGSGYPKCKQVTLPVGDGYGNVSSPADGTVWIKGKIDPGPVQTKWVQDRDNDGIPLFMPRMEYEIAPKTLYPDGSPIEGFSKEMFWEKYIDRKSMAGIMVCGLAVAFLTFSANKE
jgi:hypothetical protein